ncbi:hypothetical protein HMPREF1210_01142 [Paenisporosarcina sp. HGH0030]|uniref:hypothetical protein n=1 Tax=Paenisporosarcina sp. HGH0030 TaxID=1078085 RepID=UPI00034E4169|nr:hypothetical protein [Paenisporosarcina sp. HGH0030]EPD52762.1 hypothetical protein HMPREF1210_01142 [Paenisporosarcina sp. HGH0030]
MDVFEIIKAKLPADKLPDDTVLAMHVAEVGQSILTYCNIASVPPGLTFVHANMVIDLINGEIKKQTPDEAQIVKSIKEGDVQVSFGSTSASFSELTTEQLINDYKSQLNKFRQMRW